MSRTARSTLHDASDLWGKDVHETIKVLQERHGGEKDLSVIAIGPAGENLVKFACWMNENDRASGRGGTGCVGGSKNLKAIVIKGKHADRPKPADKEAFKAAQKVALAQLMDERVVTSPRKGGLSVYGTNVLMNITNNIGGLPARNGQVTSFGERAELISGEYVKEHILVNDPTCHACPVACKKEVEVKEGPFKVHMESVEYEPAWSLGAICGNDDIAAVAYMIDRANDYGYRRHRDRHRAGDVHGVHPERLCQRRRPGLGRHARHGGDGAQDRVPRGRRRHPGRRHGQGGEEAGPSRAGHGSQGPGHPGLRPARHQGHGHRLCHLQPRRLPPARLHAGRRGGRQRARPARPWWTRWPGRARAS